MHWSAEFTHDETLPLVLRVLSTVRPALAFASSLSPKNRKNARSEQRCRLLDLAKTCRVNDKCRFRGRAEGPVPHPPPSPPLFPRQFWDISWEKHWRKGLLVHIQKPLPKSKNIIVYDVNTTCRDRLSIIEKIYISIVRDRKLSHSTHTLALTAFNSLNLNTPSDVLLNSPKLSLYSFLVNR